MTTSTSLIGYSKENPMIDSDMTIKQALRRNPRFPLDEKIYEKLDLFEVTYYGFDALYHQGQIVMDRRLVSDVKDLFEFLLAEHFPVGIAVPVAHPSINFDDNESMALNNSSGFNPRFIAGTEKLSLHAPGQALDVNPWQNPFISGNVILPQGAWYNPEQPGTFLAHSHITRFLTKRGWSWGGDWETRKDYHHFEKRLID